MKFRPLHDRVVIERIEAEAKSAGGIIIPDTAREKPQQGRVSAVGPGGRDESGKLIPIDVKVGNRILFGKWSGTEVKIDDVDYLIMKESDIMGCWARPMPRRRPPECALQILVLEETVKWGPLRPRKRRIDNSSSLGLSNRVPRDEVEQKGILRCLPRK